MLGTTLNFAAALASRINCCLALVPNDNDPSADRTAL